MTYDYGRAGIIGIGTPQANPTVEAEMRIILPPDMLMTVSRLTSRSEQPATRLRDYFTGLGKTLESYDTLRLDAFGFACTASSYLIGNEAQRALKAELESRFDYPVITATDAIQWRLNNTGMRRIALVSPYPPTLVNQAVRFWREAGYEIASVRGVDTGDADTRSIYSLGSDDARLAMSDVSTLNVDAILLSGTGMPSLRLIADAVEGPPVLSSNLCLAERLCDLLGLPPQPIDEWRARLDHATSTLKVTA